MQHDEQEDQTLYKVVVNHEEQYSYTKVRCIADVDLATFGGQGHLEIIAG